VTSRQWRRFVWCVGALQAVLLAAGHHAAMSATLCNELTTDKVAVYTAQQKKQPVFFCVHLF